MPSLKTVCPMSGISYTVIHSQQVNCFAYQRHPLYGRLHATIAKSRWKTSSDFLIGGIFETLEKNSLIVHSRTESHTLRYEISQILQSTFTASQLYRLYSLVRDSKAPLKESPLRLNLGTLAEQSPKDTYAAIEAIANQQISESDRTYMWSESQVYRKKLLRGELGKKKVSSPYNHRRSVLTPEKSTQVISKAIKPLMEKLSDLHKEQCPHYYSNDLATKLSQAVPLYSLLSEFKQTQLLELLSELFTLGIRNNLVTLDSAQYKAYFYYIDIAQKGLLQSDNNVLNEI